MMLLVAAVRRSRKKGNWRWKAAVPAKL